MTMKNIQLNSEEKFHILKLQKTNSWIWWRKEHRSTFINPESLFSFLEYQSFYFFSSFKSDFHSDCSLDSFVSSFKFGRILLFWTVINTPRNIHRIVWNTHNFVQRSVPLIIETSATSCHICVTWWWAIFQSQTGFWQMEPSYSV